MSVKIPLAGIGVRNTVLSDGGLSEAPEKIKKAAQQFEALIIEQMLKSVRESSFGGGWGTSESDPAGETTLQMADQQMAQMLAANGGLGLARLIETGLQTPKEGTSRPQSPKASASRH